MYQLFFNLLGNALKFARRDVPPVITINGSLLSDEKKSRYTQLHQQKDYYEVTITDNGVGFEQEYAEKIFTIFQRLNERSMYGGYGIGLALCKKIVDSHHGVIYAESKPKEGAAFTFILPFTQD
jgi:signal transduction histidine kinase